MGYGRLGFDRPISNGDLCFDGSNSDNFDKEMEAVFQLRIGNPSDNFDIESKSWRMYGEMTSVTSGFICEKEGQISI